MAQPGHFAHLIASSSPFRDGAQAHSPLESPASDIPRYFSSSEREYDEGMHSFSSPPSSVPSSANTSFSTHYPSFQQHQLCQDASPFDAYNSSPLAGAPVYQYVQAGPPPPPQPQLQLHMDGQPHQQNFVYPSEDPYAMMPAYNQAPRANMIPGLAVDGMPQRPDIKRRKTCPEITSSPTKRICKEKKGAGKDGENVWPEDTEIAFFESIRLVPKLGRKKISVNGKPCGRNELIGDYIRRKTGKLRSRKQVSSHIQVLKNIKRNDYEFMNLVAEPKAGEQEDDFTPEASALFFAPQEFAHVVAEDRAPSPPESAYSGGSFLSASLNSSAGRDGLLSPYHGGFSFSHAPSSGSSSPALSSCSTRSVSPYAFGTPVHMQQNDDLPQAIQTFQLKLAPPSPAVMGMPSHQNNQGAVMAPQPPPASVETTPRPPASKLGHRRVASRGLSLHIPPNTFGQHIVPEQGPIEGQLDMNACSSNPTTPWPQVMHTPTCPPPAPPMIASPTQRNRLPQIWANSSADWNKASPALESSFEHELTAAVQSSRNMQQAAARTPNPLKRSNTDVPLSSSSPASKDFRRPSEPMEMRQEYEQPAPVRDEVLHAFGVKEEADSFFTSLLGSREY